VSVTYTPSPDRFQVAVERAPEGGFYWHLKRWDGSLARALGPSSGWEYIDGGGPVRTRAEAEHKARKYAENWIWRQENPAEIVSEFEIQRSDRTAGE
jgi:hypothetical protein